eukprot:m51a1_g2833 putative flag-tagged protein kinase domain of mitogen-activated protein kinase kinase kinase (1161) ;mRNA; f:238164-241997
MCTCARACCLVLAVLCALAAPECVVREPVVTPEAPEVLVGLTSSSSRISAVSSRTGLGAALADATAVSRLVFRLAWLEDHGDHRQAADNARELLCNRSVFLLAATVGSDSSVRVFEAVRELPGPTGTLAPLVGAMTSAPQLRDPGRVVGADGRVGVVNVRSEAVDEVSAVLSFLSHDVDVLRRTAVACSQTQYGALWTAHIRGALQSLGLHPWAVANVSDDAGPGEVTSIVDGLLKTRSSTWDAAHEYPAAIVLPSTGGITASIIAEVVARGVPRVKFVCGSNPGPRGVWTKLGPDARAGLARLQSKVYFQQYVPVPSSTASTSLIRSVPPKGTPHADVDTDMLEGYVVGRLIAMAATRSLEIYGWPLTRQTFLDTVYRSYRTFDLRGTQLGPFGDGAAPQPPDDWCSHGAHEIFMHRLDVDTGQLLAEPSSSFRYAGCNVQNWSASRRAVVGLSVAEDGEQSVFDDTVRLGLTAALQAANSDRSAEGHLALAASFKGDNVAHNVRRMLRSAVLAAVGLDSVTAVDASRTVVGPDGTLPLVAPLSGSPRLRFPFESNRAVINVVPLVQQEISVALQYLRNVSSSVTRIAVVHEDTDAGREYFSAFVEVSNNFSGVHPTQVPFSSFSFLSPIADAYVFAGRSSAAAQFLVELHKNKATWGKAKVLCSDVLQDLLVDAIRSSNATLAVLSGVRLLCSTPPLAMLSRTDDMRQEYEQWVSEVDRGESSFRGFFVGLFLNAVITAIDDSAVEWQTNARNITSGLIVDTVYRKQVFDVGRFSTGRFVDDCATTGASCCNQGFDEVYITEWRSGEDFGYVAFSAEISQCGAAFNPHKDRHHKRDPMLGLTVGLSVGLGVAAAAVVVLSVSMYLFRKRTLSFLNIKRPDLEINECIGSNRFGQLHVGDWHGTTVAIRVIEKKELSKGDLAAIKEEIGLLHKLHHPNLLMLMGYCETRNELYVVSEYMSGGSLKEYLARNRGQLGVFSLIAMAFDVVKGIAYLHASKPPIVHGSISTRSLLVDDKLTTKVAQHPEPDASMPQEVVELLYQCWEPQPDQRPTIFTVLRSWPSTFASIGRFELPSDLSRLQITEDSRTSGTGPDAVVPVAMMSHSEQSAVKSLHFEFQTPSDVACGSVLSTTPVASVSLSSPIAGEQGVGPCAAGMKADA